MMRRMWSGGDLRFPGRSVLCAAVACLLLGLFVAHAAADAQRSFLVGFTHLGPTGGDDATAADGFVASLTARPGITAERRDRRAAWDRVPEGQAAGDHSSWTAIAKMTISLLFKIYSFKLALRANFHRGFTPLVLRNAPFRRVSPLSHPGGKQILPPRPPNHCFGFQFILENRITLSPRLSPPFPPDKQFSRIRRAHTLPLSGTQSSFN